MPYKPKHPCSYPGCKELVPYGERYCEEHKKIAAKQYEQYGRKEEERQRYEGPWKTIRKMKLASQPLCENCLKNGRYTRAVLVHHIIPLEEGGSNDSSNLMSMCQECHSRLHATRGDRWHQRPGGAV